MPSEVVIIILVPAPASARSKPQRMALAESERGLDFAGESQHERVAAEWSDDLHGNRHAVWRKSARQRDCRLAAQVEGIRVWGPGDPWQRRRPMAPRRRRQRPRSAWWA